MFCGILQSVRSTALDLKPLDKYAVCSDRKEAAKEGA